VVRLYVARVELADHASVLCSGLLTGELTCLKVEVRIRSNILVKGEFEARESEKDQF